MSPARSWPRRIGLMAAGVAYLAALLFDIDSDGGWDSARFFGPIGFAVTFPLLILSGRLVAALVSKLARVSPAARAWLLVAPTFLAAGLLVWEGYLLRDPVRRIGRHVGPPPPSLRILASYQYSAFNAHISAYHFVLRPDEYPAMLREHPFRRESDPGGFNLDQVRANGRGRPGYPIPPQDFRAVHRIQLRRPNRRLGLTLTLYGDARGSEFFAYRYAE